QFHAGGRRVSATRPSSDPAASRGVPAEIIATPSLPPAVPARYRCESAQTMPAGYARAHFHGRNGRPDPITHLPAVCRRNTASATISGFGRPPAIWLSHQLTPGAAPV